MGELYFRFRFVVGGAPRGYLTSRGSITRAGLRLAGRLVPFDAIRSASVRDGLLVVGLEVGAAVARRLARRVAPGNYLVMDLDGVASDEAKRLLDGALSVRTAAAHEANLAAEGKAAEYRSCDCPDCLTRVDLSGLPVTEFVHCPTCDGIFYADGNGQLTAGDSYRCCEECDLFGHVRAQAEVYRYAFIVANRWSYRRRHLCDSCGWRMFSQMLWRNLLFLVGLPATLLVPLRLMRGRDRRMRGLAGANRLALAGRVAKATPMYERMRQKLPEHPGLLYDEAVARLTAGDSTGAFDVLQRSLEACANYAPSHRLLRRIEHFIDGTAPAGS